MNCTKTPTLKTRRLRQRKKDTMKIRTAIVVLAMVAVSIVFLVANLVVSFTGTVQAEDNKINETNEAILAKPPALPITGVSTISYTHLMQMNMAERKELVYEQTKVETTKAPTTTEEPMQPVRENKLYCVIDDGQWRSDLDVIYQDFLWEKCVEYDITDYYELLLAQMYHESGFKIKTISATNDYGLMQINQCNHEWLSEKIGSSDFLDPYVSIEAGVIIMSEFLHKYNDVQKALVCYNRGEKAVINGTYSTSYSQGVLEDMEYLVEIDENGKEK